uniref:TOG domain-containing protein n=1 Tax=Knipowitschia caucasica TaxID=637954 RepID=A0AAV2L7V8_KNICA
MNLTHQSEAEMDPEEGLCPQSPGPDVPPDVSPEVLLQLLSHAETRTLGHVLQMVQDCPALVQDQSAVDRAVDTVVCVWVNHGDCEVVLLGMELLSALVSLLQEAFRTQVATVLPSLMDRLGDVTERVREQDQALLLKIMDQAANPQFVWERMMGGFKHKNSRTREGLCLCLMSTLNVFGSQSLTLSKIVPHICSLLEDPSSAVRGVALNSLVEIYRHVGEKVRIDLGKKGLPQSRLNLIFSRFDEVQRSGNMVLSPLSDQTIEDDDSSRASMKKSLSFRRSTKSGRETAGALDEEDFMKAFKEVPTQLLSHREVEEGVARVRDVLSDEKRDWEQRVAALEFLRVLLVAGASKMDSFLVQLRLMETSLRLCVRDLRSQVVREACITLGHLSSVLGLRFDRSAEALLPSLIGLIPSSTKIMASSGITAVRVILKNTHFHRLVPIVTGFCSSKSVVVRRRCFEFLLLQLQQWQTSALERHASVICDSIKKGIHDADSEARCGARNCYWSFRSRFSREAELLYNSLEQAYQRALQAHRCGNETTTSLPASDRSSSSSQESLSRPFSVQSSGRQTRVKPSLSLSRSHSDVDRNKMATASTLSPGSYASLGRVQMRSTDTRERSKPSSHSQPGSRSGSPGRVLGSFSRTQRSSFSPQSRAGSRGHRSQETSRETSPSRGVHSRIPRPSLSQGCSRETSRESSRDTSPTTGLSPNTSRRVSRSTSALTSADGFSARISASVNAMRVLNTGTEVEAAVADALLLGDSRTKPPPSRRFDPSSLHSDDEGHSDASSCSDRSHHFLRRSDHFMRPPEDAADILNRCASANWTERKEGLQGLQVLLRSTRVLSRVELKRLCEIFTRMFADPHSKLVLLRSSACPLQVFSMFLETLVDFVAVYREDLQDWLFVLLTQLLKKMGADLLGSVQTKVQKALDVTRASFPCELQFNILMRFIVDQTQTPNLKVKTCILQYVSALSVAMETNHFSNSSETRLAVSRIITWTTEPKSAEVRKAAQGVLISLFELNPPEFSMLLGALPKTFQDGTTKLLHHHLQSAPKDTCLLLQPAGAESKAESKTSQAHSATFEVDPDSSKSADENRQSFNLSENQLPVQALIDPRFKDYNPHNYTDPSTQAGEEGDLTEDGGNKHMSKAFTGSQMSLLLKTFSQSDGAERRSCLVQLLQFCRETEDSASWWEQHFKTTLLLLLDTLTHSEAALRALSLRVLKEILRKQSPRFNNYTELTIIRILEAHRDTQPEVVRAAEDTSGALASALVPEQCLKVLCPIVQTADFPVNMAAIKMQTRAVERVSPEELLQVLPELVPGLLQGYDNTESSVRKASVFCLVSIYSVIGEDLKPHLSQLTGSKMKLLNLYIKRAQTQSNSSSSSDVSSY